MIETPELLQAYASQGSEAAFRALVERYLPLVYLTALRQVRGNTTLAEEISQDVFTILARKSVLLAHRATLGPWLFRATRLSAINRLRHEQRRVEREQKAFTLEQLAANTEPTHWESSRPLLDNLLSQLSLRDQEALFMRYFEGRTFSEIGERLKIGENGARYRSNRALEKVRVLLSRRGIHSTSAALAEALATQQVSAVPSGLAAVAASEALAAGAWVSGGLVSSPLLFSIMNTSPMVAGVLAVLALGGIGSGLYQAHLHRDAEGALHDLRLERMALRTEIAGLHQRMLGTSVSQPPLSVDPEAAGSANAQADTAKASAPSRPGGASNPVPSSIESLVTQIDHVLAHPELRSFFVGQVIQQLSGSDQRYFKSAGVSSAQIAAIRKEAADYANTLLDARARRIGGEDFVELFTAADEYSFNQVRQILGEDAFQQMKQFKAYSRENNLVDQLAARLYFTDSPLTLEQANQLADILAQHRFSTEPSRPMLTHVVAGEKVSGAEYSAFRNAQSPQHSETRVALITDAAIVQATGTVPPPILAALKAVQATQINQIKLTPPAPDL